MTLEPLANSADVQAILGRTPPELAQTDRLLELASGIARAHMGQMITRVVDDEVTIVPDADGVLWLPQRPITEVTSVALGATEYATTTYRWGPDGGIYSLWGNPWQMLSINGPGYQPELSVVYTHGFETIPDDIVATVAQMVADVHQRTWRSTPESGVLPSAGLGLNLNRAQKAVLNRYRRNFTSFDIVPAGGRRY